MSAIDVSGYRPTDAFFGAPYIDEDEEIGGADPHRMIHGGFDGTDTRFRFHFPPAERWGGRMFAPLQGGSGGSEDGFSQELVSGAGYSSAFRLGAYMVQTNQGHIGDTMDPKAGTDASVYGFRATNESARFSKYVAAQIYGEAPHHSYVYGGSGGGQRSPNCFENGPDVWDGCLPFVGAGEMAPEGQHLRPMRSAAVAQFCTMLNVQRLLGPTLRDVVDATAPGGSGDPFAGLTVPQREELARLYKLGFPRGDEPVIGAPFGMMWFWAAHADLMYEQEPDYFDNFWTKAGYAGHDTPEHVVPDLLDTNATVARVLTGKDVLEDPRFDGPEHHFFRMFAGMMGRMSPEGSALPVVVELPGVGDGYRLGTGIRLTTGAASGRQLYSLVWDGDFFLCDGRGEASNLRFTGVEPGDEVHLDNSQFLAYCHYSRHHLMDGVQFDSLKVDGVPIYPQHRIEPVTPLIGVCHTGSFEGKMIWVQSTHDYSLWPNTAVTYHRGAAAVQGDDALRTRYRLRWTQNAEHGPPTMLPANPGREPNTWLIDYGPIIEQSLQDLIDWVERDVAPAGTNYEYEDGLLRLPATAVERGGIQPVVDVHANGAARAEVAVGEEVTLTAHAGVPPGASTVIAISWDFDGNGTYPYRQPDIDGRSTIVDATATHTYDAPGTYFVTALAESHRDGDINTAFRRIPNLAQARVVVQ